MIHDIRRFCCISSVLFSFLDIVIFPFLIILLEEKDKSIQHLIKQAFLIHWCCPFQMKLKSHTFPLCSFCPFDSFIRTI